MGDGVDVGIGNRVLRLDAQRPGADAAHQLNVGTAGATRRSAPMVSPLVIPTVAHEVVHVVTEVVLHARQVILTLGDVVLGGVGV